MPLSRTRLVAAVLTTALVPAGVLVVGTGAAGASDAELGTAAPFALLASSTITNTGPSNVTGDLGLSPGTSLTGFPPGTLVGTSHIADAVALRAKADALTAYNIAAALPPTETVSADLGGRTLAPGVYSTPSGLGLTGTLTLDGGGNAAAAFVLRAGTTLTTASASRVLLVNGADPCNVTWVVGSSATLGTNSTLAGTVLASASITATTGADVQGRLLAGTGAVTLDTNDITRPVCTAAVTPEPDVTALPSASASPAPTASATPGTSASPSATPSAAVPVVSVTPSAPTTRTSPVPAPVAGGGAAVAGPTQTGPSTGATTTDVASGTSQLPRTGTDARTTAAWAALLALVGAALVLAGSGPVRRHSNGPRHRR